MEQLFLEQLNFKNESFLKFFEVNEHIIKEL